MKAKEFLKEEKISYNGTDVVYLPDAFLAVDMAKEEVTNKAVRAFKECCQYQVNSFCEYGDCECDMKALYCANFKKMLYEE